METVTLIVWLTMGWRFEETSLPLLGRAQCAVFRDEMLAERTPVRAECVAEPAPPAIKSFPPCADGACRNRLPGNKLAVPTLGDTGPKPSLPPPWERSKRPVWPVICPFTHPCWRNGEPIVGAL
jgi:hypothetical protein